MYDVNAVNAVTRAMRSEASDHVTACEKNSLRELRVSVLSLFKTHVECGLKMISYLKYVSHSTQNRYSK